MILKFNLDVALPATRAPVSRRWNDAGTRTASSPAPLSAAPAPGGPQPGSELFSRSPRALPDVGHSSGHISSRYVCPDPIWVTLGSLRAASGTLTFCPHPR